MAEREKSPNKVDCWLIFDEGIFRVGGTRRRGRTGGGVGGSVTAHELS